MRNRTTRRAGGFTLIELLAVIAIIGALAGIVLGVAGYATRKADRSKAVADMERLRVALEEYRMANGSYLAYSGGLTGTTRQAALSQYVGDLNFDDPWGQPYIYRNVSRFSYELMSYGPDAKSGTAAEKADDVISGRGVN